MKIFIAVVFAGLLSFGAGCGSDDGGSSGGGIGRWCIGESVADADDRNVCAFSEQACEALFINKVSFRCIRIPG